MANRLTTIVIEDILELLDKELKDKLDREYLDAFKELAEVTILNSFYQNGITP